MRRIVVGTPWSERVCQNALPWRKERTSPPERGNVYGPKVSLCLDSVVSPREEKGSIVAGSRCTKSKMPWPPGSSPGMNVDQATGLCGGGGVPRGVGGAGRAQRWRGPRAVRRRGEGAAGTVGRGGGVWPRGLLNPPSARGGSRLGSE